MRVILVKEVFVVPDDLDDWALGDAMELMYRLRQSTLEYYNIALTGGSQKDYDSIEEAHEELRRG